MTITPYIETFLQSVCAGKDNETESAYRSKLKRLDKWMSEHSLELQSLTCSHIERFRQSMQEQKTVRRGSKLVAGKLSPYTIHTVLRTVKHFITWAHKRGLTACDLTEFRIHPPPLPDPKAAEASNVLALLLTASHMGEPWERARNLAMLYVLRDTGGRISAILNSDLDNLDLCEGRLYTKEKGDKPATLFLNAPTVAALKEWILYRPQLEPKDEHLFISFKGTRLTRSGFYSLLHRLISAGNLGGRGRLNPHAFRHALARDFLNAGGDITKLSQLMHHSTIRVTSDYYARWSDGELKNAHAQFSPGAKMPIILPEPENDPTLK